VEGTGGEVEEKRSPLNDAGAPGGGEVLLTSFWGGEEGKGLNDFNSLSGRREKGKGKEFHIVIGKREGGGARSTTS